MPAPNEFHSQVEAQRTYLVRYASLQLRDPDTVEDVVQDTLVAALAGEANFAGRSNLRTWLTGILKHKIIDAIRRISTERKRFADEASDADEFDALFETNGHWVEHPPGWENPDATLEQKQFFAVLEECLARLPARISQAFMMREHLGLDTEEICNKLDVTPTNCGVMLYRVRMALQLCLDKNWFGK